MEHERRIPRGVGADPALRTALDGWQAAVVRLPLLDPVTTELVRLRAAAVHDCRLCGSLRLADAREQGVDEGMVAKLERYEESDLPERHKLALRLADALMTQPGDLPAQLATDLHAAFSDEELLELTLDVMKWNYQKVPVALRTDVPFAVGTALAFDESGAPRIDVAVIEVTS